MRFLMTVNGGSAAPDEQMYAEMGRFVEELARAGVLLATGGLDSGTHVVASGGNISLIDGPFAESKELVAGYWIWQVKSIEEAVEWLKRAPFDGGTEVTIRPVFEPEDFGRELTPELRKQGEQLRADIERQRDS